MAENDKNDRPDVFRPVDTSRTGKNNKIVTRTISENARIKPNFVEIPTVDRRDPK